MTKNFNLPLGTTDNDPEFYDAEWVRCLECDHLFHAGTEETVCPRCQNKMDKGDDE